MCVYMYIYVYIYIGRGARRTGRTHLPEAESLVGGTRHDCVSIGAHSHVEHTRLVPGEVGNLRQGRVLPQGELILGEAVGGQNLLLVLGPDERADLR